MQTPHTAPPAKRGLPAWAWVLIGCGGSFFLVVLLLMIIGGVVMYRTVNANPESRFVFAVQSGNMNGVRKQLDENPQLASSSDSLGRSPLGVATQSGNLKMVKLLLSRGADVNAKSKLLGQTPLHEASPLGSREIMKLLVDKKANVNITDELGETPLHKAAQLGNDEAADVLIAAGADVNAKNKNGTRPLTYARETGGNIPPFAKKMMKFASEHQADQQRVHLPSDESYKNTEALLVKHGAKE